MESTWNFDRVEEQDGKHNPTEEFKDKKFSYGTAGFRTHADALDKVCFRVGLVAAIRACETGAAGVMITASHNSREDNGVKIIDKNGAMITQSWEDPFTDAVNATDLNQYIQELVISKGISFNPNAIVLVAGDTRDSTPRLIAALTAGIETLGVKVKDFGELTTPQLHFLVWFANKEKFNFEDIQNMTEQVYYYYYKINLQEYWKIISTGGDTSNYQSQLVVDTANGIGGKQLQKLDIYSNASHYGLDMHILNDGSTGTEFLNQECGAE